MKDLPTNALVGSTCVLLQENGGPNAISLEKEQLTPFLEQRLLRTAGLRRDALALGFLPFSAAGFAVTATRNGIGNTTVPIYPSFPWSLANRPTSASP